MLWEDCAGEDAVDEAVYEALKKLPKDLNETYQRCLSRVNRDSKRKSIANRVLKWICVAVEPFQISQLQEALVVRLDTGELENSPLHKEEVMTCCANLAFLEMDGPDELVLLAHHSVRQFLFPSTTESAYKSAEVELGELCVIHLYKHRPVQQLTKHCTEFPRESRQTTLQLPRNIISTIGTRVAPAIFRLHPHRTPVSVQLPILPSRNFIVSENGGFLSYSMSNWALLTRNLTTTSRYWTQFKELALLNSQAWEIYPWGPSRPSWDSHVFALYGWSIISCHYSLLSLAIDQQTRVKKLIFELPLFDQVGKQALLPLHAAAEAGDVRVVKLLLKILAKVDDRMVTDDTNWTPLQYAANKGHEAVVQLLLESKADVDAKADKGGTALHRAAVKGHEVVVRLLLESKADVDAKADSGRTALLYAAANGHEVVVRLLLEGKADVDAKDNGGGTPLHKAADNGHEAVVRLLLEGKAGVDAKDNGGGTPLLRAAENGHEAVVRLLLEGKADVDAKDNDGWTALHFAKGKKAVVRLIKSTQGL
jgi:ankyrin repeat protein